MARYDPTVRLVLHAFFEERAVLTDFRVGHVLAVSLAGRRAVTEDLAGRAAIGVLIWEVGEFGLSELPFLAAEAASRDDAIDAASDERLGDLR